ncbi:DUF6414 family protein [Shinella sp.]|uniref:DUF6414 family protein n=1 Tax=Shinella sp. TaxID=1870904 RepID=UPI003F702741
MSEKLPTSNDQSTVELDQEDGNSVFDFLYYDSARVSSFLAQFDPSGHLTQITTTERAHRGKKDSSSTQAGGSAGIIKGMVTGTLDNTSEYGKQQNRTYDTRWANALAFLDYLTQRDFLKHDLAKSAIGDLVLYSGSLSVLDLGILKQMWNLPVVRKTIIAGAGGRPDNETGSALNRKHRRKFEKVAGPQKSASSEAEIALELLSVLPHSIQAAVSAGDTSVWCTLREDSITVTPSDLFMKHGMAIGERWNIVGVLDAFPDSDTVLKDGTALESAKQFIAGSKLGSLAMMLGPDLAPAFRAMLGRPTSSYGFTPLLIFREVLADQMRAE